MPERKAPPPRYFPVRIGLAKAMLEATKRASSNPTSLGVETLFNLRDRLQDEITKLDPEIPPDDECERILQQALLIVGEAIGKCAH